jgi:hypothetical protein
MRRSEKRQKERETKNGGRCFERIGGERRERRKARSKNRKFRWR